MKIIFAIAVAAMLTVSGCGREQPENTVTETPPAAEQKATPNSGAAYQTPFEYCEYTRLGGTEKKLYDELCVMIEDKQTEFTLKNYDEHSIENAFKAIIADHPEYFWLNGGYSYSTTAYADRIETVLKPVIAVDMSDIPAREAGLNTYADRIISDAEKNGGAIIDKLIYIHDYLVENTNYDDATYQLMAENGGNGFYDAATAYGGIVSRKAVCSGYASSFQLLAQRLGVPCGRVSGERIGGGTHEWNYVIIDDEYYYIDVTWDDPQSAGGGEEEGNKSYDFFCITSAELLETHIINDGQYVPDCTAVKYDYYIYNNLYMDKYDFDGMKAIAFSASDGIARVKFSDSGELDKAVEDLFGNSRIFELTDGSSVKYFIGEAGRTLKIHLR